MEDGGYVSHDWQPQVIATFGEHKLSDLLKPPHDADMLRAGGHLSYYTPPSAEAMYTGRAEDGVQMAMGGDLQVGRGSADTMSYNPYLPGDGETVMFRGPSHDDGGMPIVVLVELAPKQAQCDSSSTACAHARAVLCIAS